MIIRCFTEPDVQILDERLAGADLSKLELHRACLEDADLQGADFTESNLRCAYLFWADVSSAIFLRANLASVNMLDVNARFADFKDALCIGSGFRNGNFYKARFQGANVSYAEFGSANLKGADCRFGEWGEAIFQGAIYDAETLWPPELDPEELGMSLIKNL